MRNILISYSLVIRYQFNSFEVVKIGRHKPSARSAQNLAYFKERKYDFFIVVAPFARKKSFFCKKMVSNSKKKRKIADFFNLRKKTACCRQ